MKQLMFKYFILCVLYFLFGFIGFAQNKASTSSFLDFKDKNYYEIISERDSYWQQKLENNEVLSKEEAKEHKFYMRWKAFWENRLDENGGFTGPFNAMANQKKIFAVNNEKTINPNWTPIGPYGIDVGLGPSPGFMNSNSKGGIGAIHTVAYDPTDKNIIYAGASFGGIFKTTNGGDYWWNITDGYPNIYGGVRDIIVDPNNPNHIYANLSAGLHGGYAMFRNYYTMGVIKSADGGLTWSSLNDASSNLNYEADPNNSGNGRFIQDMMIHPSNGKFYILVSENAYSTTIPRQTFLYEASLGSNQWTLKTTFTGEMHDLKVLPGNHNIFFVAGIQTFNPKLYSRHDQDIGDFIKYDITTNIQTSLWSNLITHLNINNSPYTTHCATIATTNADPNNVYLYACGAAALDRNFVKFNFLTNTFSSPTQIAGGPVLGPGGGILRLSVSDYNSQNIYVGKISLKGSNNGGLNFSSITTDNSANPGGPLLHLDFNDIDFFPNSDELIIANDGGIIHRNQNLAINENKYISGCGLLIAKSYSLWIDERYENSFLVGNHDGNSALRHDNGEWQTLGGGDAGMSMISPSGDKSESRNGLFRTPFALSPGYKDLSTGIYNKPRMFHPVHKEFEMLGYSEGKDLRICKDNIGFEPYSPSFGSNRTVMSFDVNKKNPEICYLYAIDLKNPNDQDLYLGINGESINIADWPVATLPIGAPINQKVTCVLSHPLDEGKLWITYGGYDSGKRVYFSNDVATTWKNHSNGLPDVPVNSIIIDENSGYLYASTDAGVYYKDSNDDPNNPDSWVKYGVNLPQGAMVSEIRINHTYNKIVAATFGRGVWEAPLICNTGVINLPSNFYYYYNSSIINGNTQQNNNEIAVLRANDKIVLGPGFKSSPVQNNKLSAKIIPCASNGIPDPCSSYMRYAESTSDNNEGIEEFRAGINIFPNPNNGIFNINMEMQNELTTVLVLNSVGKVVRNKKLLDSKPVIDISDQPKGIYFVKISSENKVKVEKIVYQ